MAKKILAVDDDPVIREIIRAMLQAEGFEVVLAENGTAALELLDSLGGSSSFSAILLDRQMPDMNGFEVLQKLKENSKTSQTSVIMLTAEDKPEDIMTGYSYGAEYYITKPFTREQLVYGLKIVFGEA